MHHYSFLTTKDRTYITRYFVTHCVILDRDKGLCYHSTGRHGYVCETLEDLIRTDEVLACYDFDSDRDIEEYFYQYQCRNGAYNAIDNNCEDFANGFIGYCRSRQTERFVIGSVAIMTMFYFLFK